MPCSALDNRVRATTLAVAIIGSCSAACLGGDSEDSSSNDNGNMGFDDVGGLCLRSGETLELNAERIDKVDLLFVVDDSESMQQEQAALRDQFERLVTTLASGEHLAPDGSVRGHFAPVSNLHLGVVSSDMGLVGVEGVPSCVNGLGGNGRLKTAGSPDVGGCNAMYPNYLSFTEGGDPQQVANDFGCVATLGTGGCGYEQQLEAGLKALWPAMDIDPSTGMQWIDPSTGAPGNRVTFLPDASGNGRFGHGDGANMGFLRNDIRGGLSLIGVVVVTDEEDCSSSNTVHFTPPQYLPDGNMLKDQPLGLRCFYNKSNLYSVDRYINGLRALRQGRENLIVFAAIAGVPTDLVQLRDSDGRATFDFEDDGERNEWFSRMLGDQRMIERVDETEPEVELRNLVPSCRSSTGDAFAPRRIVEVAQGFGQNGIVQSICQEDFTEPMDAIIELLSRQLQPPCLPRELTPGDAGLVEDCQLLWELPTPQFAGQGVPVSCAERDFLRAPDDGQDVIGARGGNLCVVAQLPVTPADRQAASGSGASSMDKDAAVASTRAGGEGWYYDDFSAEVDSECSAEAPRRIEFTDAAKPPFGVTALLSCRRVECAGDAQSPSAGAPDVGGPCLPELAPQAGYSKDRTYVESGTAQCSSGACLVYKLRGNPDPTTCVPEQADPCVDPETANLCRQQRCAYQADAQDHVYCSCRCDGASACSCPESFSCVEMGFGSEQASYCVRSSTVSN